MKRSNKIISLTLMLSLLLTLMHSPLSLNAAEYVLFSVNDIVAGSADIPIEGIVFELIPIESVNGDNSLEYGTPITEATTDVNGVASFMDDDLAFNFSGYYALRQKSVPDRYLRNGEITYFYIDQSNVFLLNTMFNSIQNYVRGGYPEYEELNAYNNDLTYQNTLKESETHSVDVLKINQDNQPLAGATFTLLLTTETISSSAVSDENGYASFNVSEGNYTLSEELAPDGYTKSDAIYTISVTPNGVIIDETATTSGGAIVFVNTEIIKEPEPTPTTTPAAVTPSTPSSGTPSTTTKTTILNKKDHYAFMQGYPDGSFRAQGNMTRAEAVVMFSRLLTKQMDIDTSYFTPYADIAVNDWYSNAIGYMYSRGFLSELGKTFFRPNQAITRAEFAILATAFEDLPTGGAVFADVPADHPAAAAIAAATERGWLKGYPNGSFKPDQPMTRAEIVSVTCRVLERSADQTYIAEHLDEIQTFNDLTGDFWAYYDIIEAANGHDYKIVNKEKRWEGLHERD